MYEAILDQLAKRPRRLTDGDEARLNREIKKIINKIRCKKSKSKNIISNRGGLSSMGARGVYLKDSDIYSRRVIVKASYVKSHNEKAYVRIRHHLNYVGRNTVDEEKKSPQLYSSSDNAVDIKDKINEFIKAPHMFNIIISPEDGEKLELKEFTREFINSIEMDLRTKLDWVAGNHFDTNEPHVHLLIKGLDDSGQKLLMKRDYISRGLRVRAAQVINKKLGLRDRDEVIHALKLEVSKPKKCVIDEIITKSTQNNAFDINKLDSESRQDIPLNVLLSRLEFLSSKELANKTEDGIWQLKDDFIEHLKQLERTTSIIEKLSGDVRVNKQNCEILSVKNLDDRTIKGHVVERGYVHDVSNKEYLLIKSKEKSFVYVELEKYSEKSAAKVGEFVRVDSTKPFSGPKAADSTIAQFSREHSGIYDAQAHERYAASQVSLPPGVSAKDYVDVHVKRLELLARKGLVNELSNNRFSIPKDHLNNLTEEASRSKEGFKAHIKITRLSPAVIAKNDLAQGLKR